MINAIQQLEWFRKNILYKDIDHTYTYIPTNTPLISATTLLKKYSKPFRDDYWSVYKCLQQSGNDVKSDFHKDVNKDHYLLNGDHIHYKMISNDYFTDIINPDKLLEEWSYKKIIGTSRGTILHNYLENKWMGKIYDDIPLDDSIIKKEDKDDFNNSIKQLKSQADKFISNHYHLIPIRLEIVLGCDKYKVAGQADALFFDSVTQQYHLYDYKTDKKIESSNQFEYFLEPLNYVQNCEFNKYCLQLSIYKYLIESKTDIRISQSNIVWFNHNNDKYKIIPLIDRRNDIEKLLHHNIKT